LEGCVQIVPDLKSTLKM